MERLPALHERTLIRLAETLVDQQRAAIAVAPSRNAPGFWFGAGNMVEAPDGAFWLCGRYRNAGDSRTGLAAGARGAELALFRSGDRGKSFAKIRSFSKDDLSYGGRQVLSIERCWLLTGAQGVELFVSTEKSGVPYPEGFEAYQKPGTGVWSIDRVAASSIDALDAAGIEPLLAETDPRYCHLKDPLAYNDEAGNTVLMFCTHPYNWSSSNTALAVRPAGAKQFGATDYTFFPRGFCWDVAVSRICGVLPLPPTGIFSQRSPTYLYFYDGAEAIHPREEHDRGVRRPRGYSCEEIGGAAYATADTFPRLNRLHPTGSLFVSPYGTGCSRYTTALQTEEGVYCSWQQSQPDRSQPLVMTFTGREEIKRILSS